MTWGLLAETLRIKFCSATGGDLSEENLRFLAEKIFRCEWLIPSVVLTFIIPYHAPSSSRIMIFHHPLSFIMHFQHPASHTFQFPVSWTFGSSCIMHFHHSVSYTFIIPYHESSSLCIIYHAFQHLASFPISRTFIIPVHAFSTSYHCTFIILYHAPSTPPYH